MYNPERQASPAWPTARVSSPTRPGGRSTRRWTASSAPALELANYCFFLLYFNVDDKQSPQYFASSLVFYWWKIDAEMDHLFGACLCGGRRSLQSIADSYSNVEANNESLQTIADSYFNVDIEEEMDRLLVARLCWR